jgi:hypothetical protein
MKLLKIFEEEKKGALKKIQETATKLFHYQIGSH